MQFDRQKKNLLTSWWWTVDRMALLAIVVVIAVGTFLVATASPAIAERIGLDSFYFLKRQLVYLSGAVLIIFGISLLSPVTIRRVGVVGFACGLMLLVVVLLVGSEANGAKRWLSLGGMSLQPSEFMKPLFIVVTAWMLSEARTRSSFQGFKVSITLYVMLVALLILQPDFGMVVVVSVVWAGQMFLAGVSMGWISAFVAFGIVGILGAYAFLPHVAHRIDTFLSSTGGNPNYQVQKSLAAFDSGGVFGRGPGEGIVKQNLPDSHTDFIFAVAGEEMGAIVCLLIVALYAFIVIRGFKRMLGETDLFIVYAVSGLLMQFGMQAMVNMGVALNLLPTKGMTLPFISYGGSSMLAIAMAMGMMLALTRRRYGNMLRGPRILI